VQPLTPSYLTAKDGVRSTCEHRDDCDKLGVGRLGGLHRVDGQLFSVNVARGYNYTMRRNSEDLEPGVSGI
jgi:hypothetical protein